MCFFLYFLGGHFPLFSILTGSGWKSLVNEEKSLLVVSGTAVPLEEFPTPGSGDNVCILASLPFSVPWAVVTRIFTVRYSDVPQRVIRQQQEKNISFGSKLAQILYR